MPPTNQSVIAGPSRRPPSKAQTKIPPEEEWDDLEMPSGLDTIWANRLRTVTVHRQILGGEQPPACLDAALLIKSRCGLAQSSINLTAAEYRSY
jgi:hypothetical protein